MKKMNTLARFMLNILLLIMVISGSTIACNGNTSSSQTQTAMPPAAIPKPPAELPASRVDVVYFHMPMRCATCICFEERSDYVVRTYFQNELASGKLTFRICQIGDKQNVIQVTKYNALGSQLFVNMVINNVDHIKDIQDIWDWHCTSDKKGFDDKLNAVIRQCIEAVK
jgi:hypothetical protein